MTSLDNIALAYQSSDSDEEEKELKSDVDKPEDKQTILTKETTIPITETQSNMTQQYRPTTKMISSSEESDSEDDSTSSSSNNNSGSDDSDSNSDEVTINIANKKKEQSNTNNVARKPKIQNDLDIQLPIEYLHISIPEIMCEEFGQVYGIVEQSVIVKPSDGKPILNMDSVLFINKGEKALGKIYEVFGPVKEPYYRIVFNSPEHINEHGINVGMQVHYCPNHKEYTFLVFVQELSKMKICDAVDEDEPPEFSDDEEERSYYESLERNNGDPTSNSNVLQRRPRTPCLRNRQSNNSWHRNPRRNNPERQQVQSWHSNNAWSRHSNMPWPPIPRNMQPVPNEPPYAGYRPTFSGPYFSSYGNYTMNNAGYTGQYLPRLPYPRVPFNTPARFNPPLPHYSHIEQPEVPYPYINVHSFQNYTGLSMPTNPFWQSSTSSQHSDSINTMSVDQNPS